MSEAGYWFIQSVWHDCVLKQVWKSLFCAGWLCISWFFSLLPRYRVPFLCPGHQHLVSHKTLCYWICLGTTGSNQLTKYLFPSYVLSLGGLGIHYQKNSFCWIWCILSSQCARSQTPEGCTTKQYRCWEFSVSCTCFSFCLLRSP